MRRARLSVVLCLVAVLSAPFAAVPARADSVVPDVDRTVRDPQIGESSGLAVSGLHPGVLWTHDDSGNAPVLYALARDGSTAARLRLSGVPNVDWEAMAAFRDGSGRELLAVADIGDNARVRRNVEIDVVAEPTTLRSRTVAPLRRITLTYPDGPSDAETLLVDPRTQRMFVVTKGFESRVYAVPATLWPGRATGPAVVSGTLERVGSLPLLFATDGVVLPDGHPLVRTYGSVALLAPLEPGTGGRWRSPELLASADLPEQRQGEGLAAEGTTLLLSSEGVGQPLLRVAMAQVLRDGLAAPSPSPVPSTRNGSTSPDPMSRSVPAGAPSATTRPASPVWTVLAAAVLAVAIVVGSGWVLGRRGPQRDRRNVAT